MWWKGLLAMKLLFRGHLHINATDKVGVWHSMRKGEVYPPGNFLTPSLPSSLSLLLSLEHHKTPIALILFPSSGGWNSRSIFIFLGLDYANYSLVWSSSVLRPPQLVFCWLHQDFKWSTTLFILEEKKSLTFNKLFSIVI